MGKYSNDILELLEGIGGKGNIVTVSHCATRLRFVLDDPSVANTKKIEAAKAVKVLLHRQVNFR